MIYVKSWLVNVFKYARLPSTGLGVAGSKIPPASACDVSKPPACRCWPMGFLGHKPQARSNVKRGGVGSCVMAGYDMALEVGWLPLARARL
jgi:hypothetical protein